jgi:hypothetical protein
MGDLQTLPVDAAGGPELVYFVEPLQGGLQTAP